MFKLKELIRVAKGFSIDSRTIKAGEVFIAIKGNNFDGHDFISEAVKRGASYVIKEKGKGPRGIDKFKFLEVGNTIKTLGEIALLKRRKFNIPVIAISGSNGKTTTKEMLASILSKQYNVLKNEGTKNNHIGLPLTLLNLDSCHDIAVLELGTNHPGEIGYLSKICQPNIGLLTNIGQSHLEYFKNLRGVLREKYTLIRSLKRPSIAVLNADDDLLKKKIQLKSRQPFILSFGIKNKADFTACDIIYNSGKLTFSLNHCGEEFLLHTCGQHNAYNAIAAISIARLFGISYQEIKEALSCFDFPQGRLKVRQINKRVFIDDTYNSNPLSFREAIRALGNFKVKGRKIVVMGDMLELGNDREGLHHQAGRELFNVCDVFITVGRLSKLAAQAAKSCGIDTIFTCNSSLEAREVLFNTVLPKEDDVILVKGSRSMKMEELFKE